MSGKKKMNNSIFSFWAYIRFYQIFVLNRVLTNVTTLTLLNEHIIVIYLYLFTELKMCSNTSIYKKILIKR